MLVGVTGRGGVGKSSLCRFLLSRYSDFFDYIEVDKLVEERVLSSSLFLSHINAVYSDKLRGIDDIISCYFSDDYLSSCIHQEFLNFVSNELMSELFLHENKHLLVDWFLLHRLPCFSLFDIKIGLYLDLSSRLSRVSSERFDNELELKTFLCVDSCYPDFNSSSLDYVFNTSSSDYIDFLCNDLDILLSR